MRAIRKRIGAGIFGLLLLVGLLLSQEARLPTASASNGDLIHLTNFSTPCPMGHLDPRPIGVGIAFDGTFLWYSCAGTNPDLYKAEPLTGQVVASYNVAGGLGALAWDGTRHKIWAGWGGGAGADGDIRLIDPANGTASLVFNAGAAAVSELDDGLAYDAQDDSLYISADTATTIRHYSTSGTVLGSFPWGGSGCYNSGLAIGGSLLFEGSDGCNHVWVVRKSNLSASFDFPTGAAGVRDEDLECDSVTFAPHTVMWSVEAYEPRRAIAFDIPAGSCGTGGGVDSDGDGLLDEWELHGVTIDPDGDGPIAPQFIDLPAMGADPTIPDIFLQIDWMADNTHSHALDPAAIRAIVDAFATSPYTSPTGSTGIHLHVDQGPNSILNFTTNTTWGSLSRAQSLTHVALLGTLNNGNYDWTAFDALKTANFTPTGRTPIFHYVVSAHNYPSNPFGSSGISRGIGASDLIISLGSFSGGVGTVNDQAGTLMHELGHNLNLQHGGSDGINYKPNYLSVMNYSFQLQGLIRNGVAGTFDYSRSALATLNESSLNEPLGLGTGAAGFGTRHNCNGNLVSVTNANGAIDWNCNGNSTETGVSYDINQSGASTDTLAGFDDWGHLKLKGGAIGAAGDNPPLPMETEQDLMTPAIAQHILPLDTTPPAISCSAADGLWHAQDVNLTCTATDTGSGLVHPEDAQFTLSTHVPDGTETADAATDSHIVCDLSQNCVTAGPIRGNKIDKKLPTIVITVPRTGTYLLNQAVVAQYTCADGGSGIAYCIGTVADGHLIDTASVGGKTFTVNAADNVGHTTSQARNYIVAYNICLLYDPTRPANVGSTIPIILQLCDAQSHNVSAGSIVVTVVGLVPSRGNANPRGDFRFAGDRYIFNLDTTGFARGTYNLQFTATGDPTIHNAPFTIR